jgi:hypothetical protein
LATVNLGMSPTLIAPNDSATVAIGESPVGSARWLVIHYQIGSTSGLGETEDWVEVPIGTAAPGATGKVIVGLSLGLAALGAVGMLRQRRPARS